MTRLTLLRHRSLLSNVASLAATTGVTSALGFGYWALAARLFSIQAVGYGSAAISAMMLLGTIGMLGLGTLLIGELPRRESPGGLVCAALLVSSLASLVLGVGFVAVAPRVSSHFPDIGGSIGRMCLFAGGVSVTALSLVLDQATIGLLRGGLQFGRNLAASVIKVGVLPVAAMVFREGLGVGLMASWVAATVVSLIIVVIRMWWTRALVLSRPDWGALRRLAKATVAHNWLNLSLAVRQSIIPVLVAVVISPAANAAFYAAWMIASLVCIVPAHLSTVLFAVTSADADAMAEKIRFSLRLSFVIGLPAVAATALLAHPILALFGAHYASAGAFPLLTLVLAYIPSVARAHYIAVFRIRGRMGRAAALMWAIGGLEIAAAIIGGRLDGLVGLSLALLAVRVAEGLVTAPAVIAVAVRRGKHRKVAHHADSQVADGAAAVGAEIRNVDRQRAGVNALIAISLLANQSYGYLDSVETDTGELQPYWLQDSRSPNADDLRQRSRA